MRATTAAAAVVAFAALAAAAPYSDALKAYNLNSNKAAQSPLDYSTDTLANYTASPPNWREIPFYTILPDKWADGDPSNNDYFGTLYEADWRETQLRFGGDIKGMANRLDYLQGMGVKGIFMSGTPFLNQFWQADSYSPLDLTVLDPHYGSIADWQQFIQAVHARGMYFMADFTVGTMGDLVAFKGDENTTAPFNMNEYDGVWKMPTYAPWGFDKYADFNITNVRNSSCVLPNFYGDDGNPVVVTSNGCYESDFDQYGDMEAFGVHPDWQRQLSKFASVQDRLREWKPEVMARLQKFSCMAITALDLDGIRLDKSTQVTVDALSNWTSSARDCATKLGKKNFLITGEVTGGDTFGALYIGRGRTPTQRPTDSSKIMGLTNSTVGVFMRDLNKNGIDGVAFHYSIYRVLTRMLGMDGNLQVAFDVPTNLVDAWGTIFVNDDMLNPNTGVTDPKHMFGTSNFDVFRWPSLQSGVLKGAVGSFITSLLMPGIFLMFYGEEQNFYLFDTTASNYLYGRQGMMGNKAWQRHGCYRLGSDQYFNMQLQDSALGCSDDWNSLDHFDPTTDSRRLFKRFIDLRSSYQKLQDGFGVNQIGNWTYYITLPGSNNTATEMGLWAASRTGMTGQNLSLSSPDVMLLWMNDNSTKTYPINCKDTTSYLQTPWVTGTVIQNLFYPFEQITLIDGAQPFAGSGPMRGCVSNFTFSPYGFKAFVPASNWTAPTPAITGFKPGHDARIYAEAGDANANNVDITLEFNTVMDCDSVTSAISLNMSSSGHGGSPTLGDHKCQNITAYTNSTITGVDWSVWSWSTTLTNVPDGVLTITVNNPQNSGKTASTGAKDNFLVRKGSRSNVIINDDAVYNSSLLTQSGSNYVFTHNAFGADMFRYSWNFGTNWTTWANWQDTTTIPASQFEGKDYFWKGAHVMMQYWSAATQSSSTVVHADHGYPHARTVPQFLVRGPYNQWGFDQGLNANMEHTGDHTWEFELMATWPTYVQLNVFGFDDYYYGDVDADGVLDRLPPNTAAPNYLNLSAPPHPHLAWNLVINDADMTWSLEPRGASVIGATMYALLLTIPIITGTLAVLIFMWSFYGIKYNKYGMKPAKEPHSYFPILGAFGKSTADLKDGAAVSEKKTMFGGHKHHEVIGWPELKDKRRKVIIATLEYEIIDWKLKVKIGGLGVMSSLMGKAMTDVDLLWVVPKVKDIEYPAGEPADPIEVIIFGEPYLIEVEMHVLDNITYFILDSPVFRAQTKADPYPARMDDLSSAIFYSTWNQAIAAAIRRFPDVDIYHVNDYHGALAPIYLLPKVMPVCLSLHNAEFQGLWPLRTKEEMKEVCSAFNISKEHCTKYVQFGNTFNLLHAAASFISVHQKSIGVAGVSDKYGKRSWARYPALWTLKHVDSLPNPDPTDIAALDEQPVDVHHMTPDAVAEAQRPEHKRQAQEWAGIKQDPNADLFVFVGRWSKQKGVDLIADTWPTLLEKKNSVQLIAVGPVIDLYGRFAAEKLARLMEMYPDRVYSKPEFTALPPYLFSGADFALIPSRDEPFGLVAVEFGRKGALGVGSRLGGLGLMPGWWFPVESTSTGHMLSQFNKTIKMALKSTEEERALLRARSAVQRFPVIEWRQRTEDFHKRSINISRSLAASNAWRPSDGGEQQLHAIGEHEDWNPVYQPEPSQPEWDRGSVMSSMRGPGTPGTPGSQWGGDQTPSPGDRLMAPPRLNPEARRGSFSTDVSDTEGDYFTQDRQSVDNRVEYQDFLSRANRTIGRENKHAPDPFLDATTPNKPFGQHHRISSVESISSIMDEKSNSVLNKAIASFTDSDGGVAAEFVQKLQSLTADNSKTDLCIEKFLMKSEEAFFVQNKKEKLSSAASIISSKRESVWGTPTPSVYDYSRPNSPSFAAPGSPGFGEHHTGPMPEVVQMTRLQIALSREIGGWPMYTIIIALGQMLSATSFQITLLSGANTETNLQLYVLGAVFLAASAVWYALFRYKPSVYVLAGPWLFFALAFLLIGIPSVSVKLKFTHDALSSAATWCYAVASAAAFAFFGLNFGEEAGASTETWMMRACVVQGSQQVWVAALWYWGHELNTVSAASAGPWWIICIVWPLAALSLSFFFLMIYGLPDYYRQTPPKVPGFLKTMFRRKLVLWFLASELLRDYWLSGPYGRNWSFLWATPIPHWQTLILILVFFVGVWFIIIGILTYFSKTHTWLLAVFAVGLGAPRWCQMLWGTSSLALYIPWAGNAGPYLGLSLWLWLGVLDAVQGVGLGMILLQTLSRLHVCATLAFSQIIGSVCVMVARATAPNRVGPESVFPDAGTWDFSQGLKGSPMASAPFWLALVCQIVIVFGYFWFYRKEQLSRP